MLVPTTECPRYSNSDIIREGKKMVDCSACYFSVAYGRWCKVKRMSKASQSKVKAISNVRRSR